MHANFVQDQSEAEEQVAYQGRGSAKRLETSPLAMVEPGNGGGKMDTLLCFSPVSGCQAKHFRLFQ